MISYAANILPTDAAPYTLENASISNGLLTLRPQGYASVKLGAKYLVSLTEHFRVSAKLSSTTNVAHATITCRVDAITSNGHHFSYLCNLALDSRSVYTAELEMIAESYELLQITFRSDVACELVLWELCPEASGDIEVIIGGVKQSLPRLLYDYNTTDLLVQQQEQCISMIACYLLDHTDLQGHFLMDCVSSERCTVHLRFMDNNMTELFSPLLFTIDAGHSTVTVPHSYLKKLAGVHNFMVTAQVTNGYITVPVRGILFTIDGGYLAQRLMDPGMDLLDLSVRSTASGSGPAELWGIGLDNEELIVKKRSYDLTQAGIAWEAVYSLGIGTAAAIEFDAYWLSDVPQSRFVTEDVPWVFFINNGTLYARHGADESTLYVVATSATHVAAVRGWYYREQFMQNDQGLVVAYLKEDGKVYYRQKLVVTTGSSWTLEETVPFPSGATPYVSISVARLNDFRVAFTVHDADGNSYTRITERSYQGDSVEPLHISASVDTRVNLAEPVYPVITDVYNISNTETLVVVDYPLGNTTLNYSAFSFTDGNGNAKRVQAAEYYDDTHNIIKLTHDTFRNIVNNVTMKYTMQEHYGSEQYIYVLNQGSPFYVPSTTVTFFAQEFTPQVHVFNGRDVITATSSVAAEFHDILYNTNTYRNSITAASNISARVVDIIYDSVNNRDVITASSNITATVTVVGESPI